MLRIGYGNDVHRLETGEKLMLGGVEIPSEKGSVGHSDGDALLHALTDAIFGALAEGDIGTHFSDAEERWKNAESMTFLRYAVSLMKEKGYAFVNVDSTVNLEKPKLRPYIEQMREEIANCLEISIECVSIKAKTGEKVDAVGEQRAVKVEVVILLQKE